MNERIKALADGARIVAETIKIHYDAFIRAGFTDKQSIIFSYAILNGMVNSKNKMEEDFE